MIVGASVSAAVPYVSRSLGVPDTIDGLKLWLRADDIDVANGAEVTEWVSRAGSHIGIAPPGITAPTLNATGIGGKPSVLFDGVDDILTFPHHVDLSAGSSSSYLCIAVLEWVANGLSGGYDILIAKTDHVVKDNWRLWRWPEPRMVAYWGSNSEYYTISDTGMAALATPMIAAWGQDIVAEEVIYMGGGSTATSSVTIAGTGSSTEVLTLGGRHPYMANVKVAELTFYKRPTMLDGTELANLETYFNARYGL